MHQLHKVDIGARVYLKHAIAGEPGCVTKIVNHTTALVHWPDMPELGRDTRHQIDSLIIDESFRVEQLGLQFDLRAA